MLHLHEPQNALGRQKSKRVLRAYTNGGHQDSDIEGNLSGGFKVWYNPSSMINILSFGDARKVVQVTMNSRVK